MAWGTPKQGTAQNKTVTEGIVIECNWRERSLKKTNTWINTLCFVPQVTTLLIRELSFLARETRISGSMRQRRLYGEN